MKCDKWQWQLHSSICLQVCVCVPCVLQLLFHFKTKQLITKNKEQQQKHWSVEESPVVSYKNNENFQTKILRTFPETLKFLKFWLLTNWCACVTSPSIRHISLKEKQTFMERNKSWFGKMSLFGIKTLLDTNRMNFFGAFRSYQKRISIFMEGNKKLIPRNEFVRH